jgi:K+-sensing histidine kinase KdpD
MDWAQILVIILAVIFAVFLLLAILLAVLLIKVTRQIKAAASNAERTVAAVELAFSGLSKASLPLTITRMVVKQLMKSKRGNSRKKE